MKFADLLFSKYASPFLLLESVISMGRLCEFISNLIEAENESKLWEYFLHRVFDKSYAEFKNSVLGTDTVSDEQLETTLLSSKSILDNFIPEGR